MIWGTTSNWLVYNYYHIYTERMMVSCFLWCLRPIFTGFCMNVTDTLVTRPSQRVKVLVIYKSSILISLKLTDPPPSPVYLPVLAYCVITTMIISSVLVVQPMGRGMCMRGFCSRKWRTRKQLHMRLYVTRTGPVIDK